MLHTTQNTAKNPQSVRTLLDLACPYLYRREGRYTLRVRPMGSKQSCTLSLKTTHRQTALTIAKHLLGTLRAFHLDTPEATWPELKENLLRIATSVLKTRTMWDELGDSRLIFKDVRKDLNEIASTVPLSAAQALTVSIGKRITTAGERRDEGNLGPIMQIIAALDTPEGDALGVVAEAPAISSSSKTITTTTTTTFKALSDLYLEERKADVKESSMRSMRACCVTLLSVIGEMDMGTHTRADLVTVRESLKEGRKPMTVNKILTQLTTILNWAVDNGHIKQAFGKKLQLTKGAESGRTGFSPEQIASLMLHANGLPADDWQRWAISLGVITGARIGEIHQLTTADLIDIDGLLVMDINTNDGKETKNKFSVRKVPLVSVYGLDLEALKAFAVAANGALFTRTIGSFYAVLNKLLREVLGTSPGTGQSFHSLRHHLAGALKAAEVPLGTAQEILGHSSGSITFDLYGAGRSVQVNRMAEALRVALVV
ncbi:tyrosine-type recombinase/integrase [Pseudomonas sp. HY7a-MNA-CIBAN-0227]|uniref:tyrosine-type recombinase/integrase n=1 Tax=Pseudomonas sp. HY7a-MNA-CIBAN-0227 TaxID=3140474 RepID=UPI00331B5BD5